MKNSAKVLSLVAALLTGNVFAAPVTQYLKLVVTENSNLTIQQPLSFLFAYSANGSDAIDANDIGFQNSITSLNNFAYPFSVSNTNNMVITSTDARPQLTSYKKVQFGFATKTAATIKIIAFVSGNTADTTNRPAYAWIEQISTGLIYPILGDTVKLDIPANENFISDFYLHTGPAITKSVIHETCYHSYDGSISINNPANNDWNLTVLKNSVYQFSSNVMQPDTTLESLTSGYYTLITSVNSIPVDSTVLFVWGAPQVIADFTIDNYNPTTDDFVTFSNISVDAVSYAWSFGDGETDSTNSLNIAHQFIYPGNYEIVLDVVGETGCVATVYDSVFVSISLSSSSSLHNGPTFNTASRPEVPEVNEETVTSSRPFEPAVTADPSSNKISIAQKEEEKITVSVMNMNGQLITSTVSSDTMIELTMPQAGIYIVQMISSKGELKSKTIMVAN